MKIKRISIAIFTAFCASSAWSEAAKQYDQLFNHCLADERIDMISCARDVEKNYIQEFAGVAQRNGDELCLKAEQAKDKKACFKDKPEDNVEQVRYVYLGQLPNRPSVAVIYSINWEWVEYRFVSTVDGQEMLNLQGDMEIALSPGTKYMAFVMANMDDGMPEEEGVMIFEVKDQEPWPRVWANKALDVTLSNPLWLSDGELRLKQTSWDNDYNPHDAGTFTIKESADGWSVSTEELKK